MEAESHPMAAVGMAELSLDRDDPGGAIPVAERVLRQHPLANRTQRAAALELAVRAKSAAGDADGARVHLEELRSVAQAVPTSPLRAAASFCDGVVAAAAGDHESAAVAFEDAVALFAASDAPYELGRARTELARSLAELGRRDLARREAAAALVVLERTGASALREACPGGTRQPRGQEPASRSPHAPRAAGTGADRAGNAGRGHRQRAEPEPAHRPPPRVEHLRQARLLDARGRSGKGRRAGDALTPRAWPKQAMCGGGREMATPGEVGVPVAVSR